MLALSFKICIIMAVATVLPANHLSGEDEEPILKYPE